MQPTPLRFKFRGKLHAISAVRAQEPNEIVWENVEVSRDARFARQALTFGIMFIMLIASILSLSFAQVRGSTVVMDLCVAAQWDHAVVLLCSFTAREGKVSSQCAQSRRVYTPATDCLRHLNTTYRCYTCARRCPRQHMQLYAVLRVIFHQQR